MRPVFAALPFNTLQYVASLAAAFVVHAAFRGIQGVLMQE